jgi:hypothetical protein
MPPLTFPTPQEAALEGFPAMYCRVAAWARQDDDAYVVVDTGEPGHPCLYGVCVAREGGGWVGGGSGNGGGWTRTDGEDALGTATAWGEAPSGATRVRAVYGSVVREAPVGGGVYLVAWFRVPPPARNEPRVEAFQVGGRWVPAKS